jgi:glycosyltransferase involved in cell wall biosynthesis
MSDSDLKQKLIQRGYEQAKKYSWEKMTNETLNIYLNITGKK